MHCKSYSHFFSKKFQHICVSLDVNFNESLTNDVVSFEQPGPGILWSLSYFRHFLFFFFFTTRGDKLCILLAWVHTILAYASERVEFYTSDNDWFFAYLLFYVCITPSPVNVQPLWETIFLVMWQACTLTTDVLANCNVRKGAISPMTNDDLVIYISFNIIFSIIKIKVSDNRRLFNEVPYNHELNSASRGIQAWDLQTQSQYC